MPGGDKDIQRAASRGKQRATLGFTFPSGSQSVGSLHQSSELPFALISLYYSTKWKEITTHASVGLKTAHHMSLSSSAVVN